MNLRNEFSEESRRLFEGAKCWMCGWGRVKRGEIVEDVNAIHHILGRESNSPYNAAPTHNNLCHLEEAELSKREFQQVLLLKTFFWLRGRVMEEKDVEFVKKHAELYLWDFPGSERFAAARTWIRKNVLARRDNKSGEMVVPVEKTGQESGPSSVPDMRRGSGVERGPHILAGNTSAVSEDGK